MRIFDSALRDPAVTRTPTPAGAEGVSSARLGTLLLNMDDVRALMVGLQDLKRDVGRIEGPEPRPYFAAVRLRTAGDRTYSVDELEQLVQTQWVGATIECEAAEGVSAWSIHLSLHPDHPGSFMAREPQFSAVMELIESVWGKRELRPITYRGRRLLGIAAGAAVLALLWMLAVIWADLHAALAAFSGAVTALVVWLAAGKILDDMPARYDGSPPGGVRVVATSQAVMDQRRHDQRRDRRIIFWTLIVSVPLSGIGGTLLASWLARP